MGKKRGQNNRRGGKRGRAPKKDEYRTDLLQKSDMRNERFESYYKAQNIIPEEEWEEFLDMLSSPLPTTFRVAGSRLTANSLNKQITETHVPMLSDVTFEDQKIPPPVQLPWYPDGLAWQFNVPKKVLRKSPEFKKFHSFLVFETEVGNISRQEAVSMLPPLFLDVEPQHRVMDMCAAPGSKTAQLLEALHAHDTLNSTSIPSGLLIANDSDYKRTHLLIHQSARLPSPVLMVTNLDASNYPSMKIPSTSGAPSNQKLIPLLFDRILCDVPCSGDGTLRKNLGIWKTWQPNDGNGLHSLQLRILQRAMKLLKHDGRIVYSTCSMNPVENEAVVAAALNTNTDFQLVDVSSMLPSLKCRPGLSAWRPTPDKTVKTTYETYSSFVEANPEAATNTKLTEGHWPPSNVVDLHLERSMRIYPHLQDSGGFFVAVLERKRSTSSTSSKRERKRSAEETARLKDEEPDVKKPRLAEESLTTTGASTPQQVTDTDIPMADATAKVDDFSVHDETKDDGGGISGGGGTFKEMPYTFLSKEDPTLVSCINRLHLTSSFPSDNVLVRNPEGDVVRSMYLTNSIVKSVIQNNDFTRIRLTAAGTKVFTRQEGGAGAKVQPRPVEDTDSSVPPSSSNAGAVSQYRILGEGLPVVLPYVDPTRILEGPLSALKTLVESYYPLLESFEEPFRDTVRQQELGCHVVRFPPGEIQGGLLSHELVLPIWKSGVSMALMIDKKAKNALSLRVFGKELPSTASAKQKKNQGEGEGEEAVDAAAVVNEAEVVAVDEELSDNADDGESKLEEEFVVQGL